MNEPRSTPVPSLLPPRSLVPLAVAAIVLAVLAAYANSFAGPFVFDDLPSIPGNPTLRQLWPIGPVLHPPPTAGVAGRPVLNLTFALNHALSGWNVWSYHALNLLIHLAAALALFGVVRRTLRRGGAEAADAAAVALTAALLWAVHPVQTASVTYLSQRAESLMGLFYLLAVYAFIRFAEGSSNPSPAAPCPAAGGRGWAALSVTACLLGMATKETMVTAPAVILLYDRVFVAKGWREIWRRRRWLHLALAGTWLLLAFLLPGLRSRGVGYGLGLHWQSYARIECWVVVHYLLLALWPHPLVFDYGFNPASGPIAAWIVILGVLLAVTLAGLLLRPRAAFAAACFFILLSPTSSVVPIAYDPMVLNRLYLPLAGVAVLAALAGHRWLGRRGLFALAILAVAGAFLTARRNDDYRSALGLWRDTAAKFPGNARAHNNLGDLLTAVPGRLPEAITELQTALRIRPGYPEAHVNLGNALASQSGRPLDAVAEYRAALQVDPDYPQAHNNLGAVWTDQPGRLEDAIGELEAAVRLSPDYADARYNLGIALARVPGRLTDAIAQDEAAVRLEPDYAEAHASLGNALLQARGRQAEAIGEFRAATRLQPDAAGFHLDLANALVRSPGGRDEAIAEYRTVLQLEPGNPRAHNNLGRALSGVPGRLPEAIGEYETALRLRPDYAEAHYNLGVALAALGRRPDAAVQLQAALRLRPDFKAAQSELARLETMTP